MRTEMANMDKNEEIPTTEENILMDLRDRFGAEFEVLQKAEEMDKDGKYAISDRLMFRVANDLHEQQVDQATLQQVGRDQGVSSPDKLRGLHMEVNQTPLQNITRYIDPESIVTDLIAGNTQNGQSILSMVGVQCSNLISLSSGMISRGIKDPATILGNLAKASWQSNLYTDDTSRQHELIHAQGGRKGKEDVIANVIMPNLPDNLDDNAKHQLAASWLNSWEQNLRAVDPGADMESELAAYSGQGGNDSIGEQAKKDFENYSPTTSSNENP